MTHSNVRSIPIPAGDERPVVTLHHIECREEGCSWPGTSLLEDQGKAFDEQTDHFHKTGHRLYWHYTIQRSQSRLVPTPKE